MIHERAKSHDISTNKHTKLKKKICKFGLQNKRIESEKCQLLSKPNTP